VPGVLDSSRLDEVAAFLGLESTMPSEADSPRLSPVRVSLEDQDQQQHRSTQSVRH